MMTQRDLGGGFVSEPRESGATAILAGALAGAGALGLASPVSIDARLDADARAWLDEVGFRSKRLCSLSQQHGAEIVAASLLGRKRSPEADGIWTDSNNDLLAIRTADCAAMWILDPSNHRLCMLHAGWRGAAAGIVHAGVRALAGAGGDPREFIAAVGPHLRPCCFEVGPEVAISFQDIKGAILPATELQAPRMRSDSVALDFSAVLNDAFGRCGVPSESVHIATACTRCHPDLFHSYRRNGAGGPLMVSVGVLTS
jgi:YfiH family protein